MESIMPTQNESAEMVLSLSPEQRAEAERRWNAAVARRSAMTAEEREAERSARAEVMAARRAERDAATVGGSEATGSTAGSNGSWSAALEAVLRRSAGSV